MDGCKDVCIDGCKDVCMFVCMHVCMAAPEIPSLPWPGRPSAPSAGGLALRPPSRGAGGGLEAEGYITLYYVVL